MDNVKFIKTLLIVILSLPLLASCRWITSASLPKYAFTMPPIPEGTPAFQKGWEHGCGNGLYSRGNEFYRTTNKFNFDHNMIDNSEYVFGLRTGYGYCAYNIFGAVDGATSSPDTYIFPGYDSWFSSMNYNDTGFFTGGLATPFAPHDSVAGGFNGIVGVWTQKDGYSVFGSDPLWSGGSKGQIFGQ